MQHGRGYIVEQDLLVGIFGAWLGDTWLVIELNSLPSSPVSLLPPLPVLQLALNFEEVRTSKIQEFGLKDDHIPKGMQVYCVNNMQMRDEDMVVVLLAKIRCQVVSSCGLSWPPSSTRLIW